MPWFSYNYLNIYTDNTKSLDLIIGAIVNSNLKESLETIYIKQKYAPVGSNEMNQLQNALAKYKLDIRYE